MITLLVQVMVQDSFTEQKRTKNRCRGKDQREVLAAPLPSRSVIHP